MIFFENYLDLSQENGKNWGVMRYM